MIGHADLRILAQTRLREAEALFAAGLYDGTVYLCSYVLEMALKACVCRTLDLPLYPDDERGARQTFRTHDFELLVLLAGLRNKLMAEREASIAFDRNWTLAASWPLEDRYTVSKSQVNAGEMLEAMTSPEEGVLTWPSRQW